MQLASELVAPRRLEERVNGILLRLEKELDQADAQIGKQALQPVLHSTDCSLDPAWVPGWGSSDRQSLLIQWQQQHLIAAWLLFGCTWLCCILRCIYCSSGV